MAKAPAACAALGGVLLFSTVLIASMQMRTALPLWDLTLSELGSLAHTSWAAARASAQDIFADGAVLVPGRLSAVLLQARRPAEPHWPSHSERKPALRATSGHHPAAVLEQRVHPPSLIRT